MGCLGSLCIAGRLGGGGASHSISVYAARCVGCLFGHLRLLQGGLGGLRSLMRNLGVASCGYATTHGDLV